MAIRNVPQEHEFVRPRQWPSSVTPPHNAQVKPWVSMALDCIGSYLHHLSGDDKSTLFEVMRNNPDRLEHWQSEGHFASMWALKAKIRDWKGRGLGGRR